MFTAILARFRLGMVTVAFLTLTANATEAGVKTIGVDETTGGAKAVLVDEGATLVHTSQVFPRSQGANSDSASQAQLVMEDLDKVLRAAASYLERVVKLNVYLASDTDLAGVRQAIGKKFKGTGKPAVSYVVGTLAYPGSRVAMDAVALSALDANAVRQFTVAGQSEEIRAAAVLPPGPKLYVSGMADTNSLIPATRKTLEKLVACIGQLGSQRADIVQLKVFLQPMSEVAQVRKEVGDFFGGKAPPTVFVDWISANPVVEIELIAAAPGERRQATNTVSYFTPPGTTDSKVYRRVARVNHGRLVYIPGLYGREATDGTGQIREIFRQLGEIARQAGTDFEHLVKATYYVTDNDASDNLNALRPEYYDPLRPPAASKAKVSGVGFPGKTITMDMIAVTK